MKYKLIDHNAYDNSSTVQALKQSAQLGNKAAKNIMAHSA